MRWERSSTASRRKSRSHQSIAPSLRSRSGQCQGQVQGRALTREAGEVVLIHRIIGSIFPVVVQGGAPGLSGHIPNVDLGFSLIDGGFVYKGYPLLIFMFKRGVPYIDEAGGFPILTRQGISPKFSVLFDVFGV